MWELGLRQGEVLSIPFMVYQDLGLAKDLLEYKHFQFPLWDTRSCRSFC